MNLTPEPEPTIVSEYRLGHFDVSDMAINFTPTFIRDVIMKHMLVVKAERVVTRDWMVNIHRYWAYSELFDKLTPNDDVPGYMIDVKDGKVSAIRIHPNRDLAEANAALMKRVAELESQRG